MVGLEDVDEDRGCYSFTSLELGVGWYLPDRHMRQGYFSKTHKNVGGILAKDAILFDLAEQVLRFLTIGKSPYLPDFFKMKPVNH